MPIDGQLRQRWCASVFFTAGVLAVGGDVCADEKPKFAEAASSGRAQFIESSLTDRQWHDLDRAVDRGLEFLSRQQRTDGFYEAPAYAQPAITSFCVMAFLSRGHAPGEGPYGGGLTRGIDAVLSTQQPSGMLFDFPRARHEWNIQAVYNHAIAGVMLGEVYGMTGAPQQERLRTAIEQALVFTRRQQHRTKRWPEDSGGWKYINEGNRRDADLSVTVWHLMFYRSAKNAGFAVPEDDVAPAVAYVKRCFDDRRGTFQYDLVNPRFQKITRAMAGAGILSLSLAGEHHSESAQRAAQFVLAHPFDEFNRGPFGDEDRYYYGAYHCSQGMFQLGGKEWAEFYAALLKTLVDNQRRDGSWEPEARIDTVLGDTYSTALAILALTPPYQLLPIYQR